MKEIFEHGYFNRYSNVSLAEARSTVLKHSGYEYYTQGKTTIFISHKHDDLDDLKGLLGFLESNYNVKVYIDSQDPKMPKKTSNETALIIRERIKQCDKFILLATNDAIESKWCNWELGFGDAQKFDSHIALFPIKPKGTNDIDYKGNEYMAIYPYIAYLDGSEKDTNGSPITKGFYVCKKGKDTTNIESLSNWLNKR